MMAITEFLLDLTCDTVSLLYRVVGKALSVVADAEIELLYGDGANWSGCCERAIASPTVACCCCASCSFARAASDR